MNTEIDNISRTSDLLKTLKIIARVRVTKTSYLYLYTDLPRPRAFCFPNPFHFFRFFALFSAVGPPTQPDSFGSFWKWNSGNNQRPGFPTAFPNAAHNACKVPKIAILSVGVVSDPSLGAVSSPYNGSDRLDAHGRARTDPNLQDYGIAIL